MQYAKWVSEIFTLLRYLTYTQLELADDITLNNTKIEVNSDTVHIRPKNNK